MGLFDMIHCHYPLPEMQDQSGEFQTKSLGRHMKHYAISFQGRLMLDLSRILGHLQDEQNGHWGLLNGCVLPLRPMVADWVRGLEEEFGCPVTPEDDAELSRRIEQLDSRVPAYHDMPYTGEVEFYDRCPVTGKLVSCFYQRKLSLRTLGQAVGCRRETEAIESDLEISHPLPSSFIKVE